jgi:hypothetical protein
MQHTERAHARLSASRAERFMTCPGSVRLEAQMPPEPAGEAAAIGTHIHELSEKLLRGEELDNPDLDPEHVAMAQEYATFVNTLVTSPRKRMIEVNVDAGLKSLHPALGGTADAVLVDGDHLILVDLKTGRVPVEAKDNKQLLTYALGVMRQFNAPASIQCTMHIFQPRAGHSKWTVRHGPDHPWLGTEEGRRPGPQSRCPHQSITRCLQVLQGQDHLPVHAPNGPRQRTQGFRNQHCHQPRDVGVGPPRG